MVSICSLSGPFIIKGEKTNKNAYQAKVTSTCGKHMLLVDSKEENFLRALFQSLFHIAFSFNKNIQMVRKYFRRIITFCSQEPML
jgi:hypothetical protein